MREKKSENNKKEKRTTPVRLIKLNSIKWEFVFSIVTSLTALVSVIIAIVTVWQMKADRDMAYKPSILINPIYYEFSWDKVTEGSDLESIDENIEKSNTNDNNSDTKENGTEPISNTIKYEELNAINVGTGTATQVVFEWHESNIHKLNDYLIQCDETKKNFMKIDKRMVVFNLDNGNIGLSLPTSPALMYMLPEAKETYEISLPLAYCYLIEEIIKCGGVESEIPHLIVSANYTDIQNQEYTDIFLIGAKLIMKSLDEFGNGNAIIQLVPLFKK